MIENHTSSTFKKKLRNFFKSKLNLYDIEDLQIGGHCGICGVWISDVICKKSDAICLCAKCASVIVVKYENIKFEHSKSK